MQTKSIHLLPSALVWYIPKLLSARFSLHCRCLIQDSFPAFPLLEVSGKSESGEKGFSSLCFQPLFAFIRDDTVLAFWHLYKTNKTRQQLLIVSSLAPVSTVVQRQLRVTVFQKETCVCVCEWGVVSSAFSVGFFKEDWRDYLCFFSLAVIPPSQSNSTQVGFKSSGPGLHRAGRTERSC